MRKKKGSGGKQGVMGEQKKEKGGEDQNGGKLRPAMFREEGPWEGSSSKRVKATFQKLVVNRERTVSQKKTNPPKKPLAPQSGEGNRAGKKKRKAS